MMQATSKKTPWRTMSARSSNGCCDTQLDQTTTRPVAIAISSNEIGGVRIYVFRGRHYQQIGGIHLS